MVGQDVGRDTKKKHKTQNVCEKADIDQRRLIFADFDLMSGIRGRERGFATWISKYIRDRTEETGTHKR